MRDLRKFVGKLLYEYVEEEFYFAFALPTLIGQRLAPPLHLLSLNYPNFFNHCR